MSRRRMMMQQLAESAIDLLEGYRIDNKSGYKVNVVWLDNDTIQLQHSSSGFMGPNTAAVNFIGTSKKQSTGYGGALDTTPIPALNLGSTYKLTLTVEEITKNTATAENDGDLTLALGVGGGASDRFSTKTAIKLSELEAGQKIEVTKWYESAAYCVAGAALQASNPNLLWDIKFKVEFEEV